MVFLILVGLTFFMQLLATPWLVMVETADNSNRTLKFRLLCSGLYIADVLLCAAISQAHANFYFIFILAGSVLSATAGILPCILKAKGNLCFFILQSGANILYTLAFTRQLHLLFNVKQAEALSLAIPMVISGLLIPFMCKKDGKFRPYLIFSVISSTLFAGRAIHLGVLCQQTNLPTMQTVSCALIMGSLALSFAILLETRQQISPPPEGKPQLPKRCMYFFGQMLIACTIIICGGLK